MSTLGSDFTTLSREAYTYLYPLVTMEATRLQSSNVAVAEGTKAPANRFAHFRAFPTAEFRTVVRPNFDTLYSLAWLDLNSGPQILHVSDTADRYFMLPLLDMWTDVFANPGKRTSGTGEQDYLVAERGWIGEVPAGLTLIESPTPHAWLLGRTQTNGPADYAAVTKAQDGYTLRPLDPTNITAPQVDPTIDMTTEPLQWVHGLSAVDFFSWGAKLLAVNPPHATDASVLYRIANIGIVPGKQFDASKFSADQVSELEAGAIEARQEFLKVLPTLGVFKNGWSSNVQTMGVYGNFYLKRAIVTLAGLGANPPEDAVYPLLVADADGDKPVGEQNYVVHFAKNELPPVQAFWSLTMYDDEGYQVANELDRFAIGDRDDLRYNDDGSLDLYLQHANPGADRESNWLPTSESGTLGVTMRLYAPKAEILSSDWNPPAVKKA